MTTLIEMGLDKAFFVVFVCAEPLFNNPSIAFEDARPK
jgi:hypothetical protein